MSFFYPEEKKRVVEPTVIRVGTGIVFLRLMTNFCCCKMLFTRKKKQYCGQGSIFYIENNIPPPLFLEITFFPNWWIKVKVFIYLISFSFR